MEYTFFINELLSKYAWVKDESLLYQYVREELQFLILLAIFTKQQYPVVFMGGTQLRLTNRINRFSEDINLSLLKPDKKFPKEDFFSTILKAFIEDRFGFSVHLRTSFKRTVVKGIISFSRILYDLGLSPLKDQSIKIKIEVDTNPPEHAKLMTTNYSSLFGNFKPRVFDLPTGFAGKCGAILQREYQKGRDYFDLQWYLSQKPPTPLQFDYLNANIAQRQWKPFRDKAELMAALKKKVMQIDHELLKNDLERFVIMDKPSFDLWIKDYIPETIALLDAYPAL